MFSLKRFIGVVIFIKINCVRSFFKFKIDVMCGRIRIKSLQLFDFKHNI